MEIERTHLMSLLSFPNLAFLLFKVSNQFQVILGCHATETERWFWYLPTAEQLMVLIMLSLLSLNFPSVSILSQNRTES